MLDIRFVRENADAVKAAMINRNAEVDVDALLALDSRRRAIVAEAEVLKAERNKISKSIGLMIKEGKDPESIKAEVREMGDKISAFDEDLRKIDAQLREGLLYIPNMPSATTPVGKDENDNPVIRFWGEKKTFDFEPAMHWDLGASLKLFDLERGAKIAGSGFPLFTGRGAKLERGLIQFMLDLHTEENGYTEIAPPFMCNDVAMTGTGQLPKFAEDMYAVPLDGLYPIPTAEVPVTNMYGNEILDQELPICLTAYTPCFRREAGSAGKDTRGLLRVHQFDKVEMVKFTTPETSAEEHEKLTLDAEKVLQKLGLHYRVIELCTGDLGFSAAKCYDIELWAPAQDKWLEVSSCSNFHDYQARRANIRYRNEDKKTTFVHTINGSGVALPRLVIAIMENNQNADGSIDLPEALWPYMGGLQKLA
ncbi:serine--tRNA ligase [Pontiella sulfatireligans]|uniref:Serine--tRNA ligase n=1 Tax=Pontiella sulfatireligans TaxID=2750658 RepID=A0A6C2UPY8_9BACT|nr:serine--tRNA ligase [Pontiella sulfatireligans]VGO21377.1 Serine--tRNA ligase [Pontiella sulfatireligans]